MYHVHLLQHFPSINMTKDVIIWCLIVSLEVTLHQLNVYVCVKKKISHQGKTTTKKR